MQRGQLAGRRGACACRVDGHAGAVGRRASRQRHPRQAARCVVAVADAARSWPVRCQAEVLPGGGAQGAGDGGAVWRTKTSRVTRHARRVTPAVRPAGRDNTVPDALRRRVASMWAAGVCRHAGGRGWHWRRAQGALSCGQNAQKLRSEARTALRGSRAARAPHPAGTGTAHAQGQPRLPALRGASVRAAKRLPRLGAQRECTTQQAHGQCLAPRAGDAARGRCERPGQLHAAAQRRKPPPPPPTLPQPIPPKRSTPAPARHRL